MNNGNLLLTVLEAGNLSVIRMPKRALAGEDPLLGHRLPIASSPGRKGWGSLWSLLYKALILFLAFPLL